MESVPGAVATGSQPHSENRDWMMGTRSLPLPVLTSSSNYDTTLRPAE